MNTMRLFTAAVAAATFGCTALYFDDGTAQAAPPKIVSGGIGVSGMDAITQAQDNYRLKLVFTEPNGEYLANVGVKVRNHDGRTVASTEAKGPVLLMTLPPGTYTVTSSLDGKEKTEKVRVRTHGLDTYYIRLPDVS